MELPFGTIELQGHSQGIICVVAIPEGNRIVTSCLDHGLRVFSAVTGDYLHDIPGHNDTVVFHMAALGGNIVASIDENGILRVWDALTAESLHSEEFEDAKFCLAALGQEKFVASVNCDLLWFAHSGGRSVMRIRETRDAHSDDIIGIAACGALVVTISNDETAAAWHADSYRREKVLEENKGCILCVDMNARQIVIGFFNGSVRVYDTLSLECTNTLKFANAGGYVVSIVLVGQGHILSVVSGFGAARTVQLSSLSSSENIGHFPLKSVNSVCVTHLGLIAAVGENVIHTCMAVLIPPPLEASDVDVFRNLIAEIKRKSTDKIVSLALGVDNRLR
jgi:WD40 repeat protein